MGQLNLNLTSINNAKTWQPSTTINDFVKEQGLRLKAYVCVGGVLSNGYGHTKNVKEGQKITIEEAEHNCI